MNDCPEQDQADHIFALLQLQMSQEVKIRHPNASQEHMKIPFPACSQKKTFTSWDAYNIEVTRPVKCAGLGPNSLQINKGVILL